MDNQRIHELQKKDQWDEIATLLAEAAARLRAGGAQGILFCSNTSYKVYSEVARRTDLPILHIADATGVAIRKSGLKKVGLVGTQYTMEAGFMADWLEEHYGIETLVPKSAAARQELQRIIQQELQRGIFKAESKKYVLQQIEELQQRGAQGIVLGCTEFPLIYQAHGCWGAAIRHDVSTFADGGGLHSWQAGLGSRPHRAVSCGLAATPSEWAVGITRRDFGCSLGFFGSDASKRKQFISHAGNLALSGLL
jgi:aspartate racemase